MYDLGFSKCEMGRKVWGLMGVAYPRFLGFKGGGGGLNRFGRCTWSEFVSRACSSRATYLLSIVSVGVFVCRYVCMYVCLWTVRI